MRHRLRCPGTAISSYAYTLGAGGVSIVYDGDGNRVQETVAGVTTRYLVSEVNPTGYVQVLAELGPTGQLLRGYEWGL